MKKKLPFSGSKCPCALSSLKVLLLLVIFSAVGSTKLTAQNLIPVSVGGFESATSTFAANGWTEKQTSNTRRLYVGTAGGANAGTKAAIAGNPSSGTYNGTNTAGVSYFYRDVAIPALTTGQTAVLSFYLK
ncbi:MAG TPA: hypothetical protein VK528_06140, partial [Flavobacterium sp.]|nr:hypothetical protein [Flavobacterium sp.]